MALGAVATPQQLRTWRGHPCVAFALRVAAVAIPLAVSFAATVVASRLVARPTGLGLSALWWLGLLTISTVVLLTTDRLARRVLPLAALLKLSLVFPDRAPSRFSFALRRGTTRQLQKKLEDYRLEGTAAAGAGSLLALVAALNVHDPRTRGHSERVRALSDLLAEQLDLNSDQRDRLHWAALLHDIGKLAVPTEILNKAGKPTDEEWAILKTHPDEGLKLVEGPIAEWLGEWACAIGEHHEKFDGTGYPRGLAGHEISLAGRLVAVADVFDVITATRSYKKPMTAQEARLELTRCAGSHFDPVMVRAFLDISIGKLRKVMGPFSWLAPIATLGRALPSAVGMSAATAGAAALTATVAVGVIPSPLAFADRETHGSSVEVVTPDPARADAPIIVSKGQTEAGKSRDIGPTGGADGDEVEGVGVPNIDNSPFVTGEPPVNAELPSTTIPSGSGGGTQGGSPTSEPASNPTTSTRPTVPNGSPPSTSPPILVTPGIFVPGLPITVPPIVVALPPLTVPPISLPPISVPPISLPPITVPLVSLPPITLPPVSLPPITVPLVSLPAITLPPIKLPKVPGL